MTTCAAHPDRPALDACPVCGRGRCGPDAEAGPGGGCLACGGVREVRTAAPTVLERTVRAALGAYAVAVPMALVVSEYVGAGLFGFVLPFLLGVLSAEAAQRAAATPRAPREVRLAALVPALVGTALGLALEGSTPLLSGSGLLTVAATGAGVALWLAPPREKRPAAVTPGA